MTIIEKELQNIESFIKENDVESAKQLLDTIVLSTKLSNSEMGQLIDRISLFRKKIFTTQYNWLKEKDSNSTSYSSQYDYTNINKPGVSPDVYIGVLEDIAYLKTVLYEIKDLADRL